MKTAVLAPSPNENKVNQHICKVLQPLIQANLDSREGFRQAAEQAREAELRAAFSLQGSMREDFARDLQQLQYIYGQREVDDGISVTGALHRAWVGLKTALSSQDDQILIEEVCKEEASTYQLYRETLDTETALSDDLRAQLSSQSLAILQSLDQLRQWAESGRYLRID